MNIAVFASGGGSNLKAIVNAEEQGELGAHVALVVSNNSKAEALAFAQEKNIATLHASEVSDGAEYVRTLIETLLEHDIELIVLAGYMKKLPEEVIQTFRGCIINIHPALLPRFGGKGMYGMKVHETVLASGELETGATVHFVDEEYDNGDIIMQERIPVLRDDTAERLAARVLSVEHKILPQAIARVAASLLE